MNAHWHIMNTSFVRSWISFCVLAIFGFFLSLFMVRDNPLQSDDPYLVGLFLGMISACLAVIYSITESISRNSRNGSIKHFVYVAAVAAWSLFWWAASLAGGEGAGVAGYTAIAGLIVGAAAWPLCRFTLPGVLYLIISCAGVLLLVMYAIVCVKMTQ